MGLGHARGMVRHPAAVWQRSLLMNRRKEIVFSFILVAVSALFAVGAAEVILRVKNSSMTNYDIEMWRYSKELKVQSPDPALAFHHVTNREAMLQQVTIRLNEYGLRGAPLEPLKPGDRRILLLGGSITLGWGVPEDRTVAARLQNMLRSAGQPAQVLNGGIGNYNAERYVTRFFKELAGLQPTDIVIQYFLRDAEDLSPGGGNFFLRNSQLAVTLWIAYHRLFDRSGEETLVDHYRRVYDPSQPGFITMQAQLKKLAQYANERGIRLYFEMIPDVHNLVDYKFGFIHDRMRDIAKADGYTYVDLLPAMRGLRPQELWAMPGDPHPNALGHDLMAKALAPLMLNRSATSNRPATLTQSSVH